MAERARMITKSGEFTLPIGLSHASVVEGARLEIDSRRAC